MKLTIIGCGYLGQALAQQLQPRRPDLQLSLTSTRQERCNDLKALADRVLCCDATDPVQLLEALEDSQAVVFCLGPKGDRQVDAAGYRRTFIDSFKSFRSLLGRLTHLQQILYTSSCSVYGNTDGAWVDESTLAKPSGGHAEVLLESEQLLSGITDRQVTILRLGALYGPGRDLDSKLKALAGMQRPGDGRTYSNWIHLDDAAGALIAALDGAWSGLVNVVNDEPIQLRDLLEQGLSRQKLEPVLWTGDSKPGSKGRRIRNTKLKALGYRLRYPQLYAQAGVMPVGQTP